MKEKRSFEFFKFSLLSLIEVGIWLLLRHWSKEHAEISIYTISIIVDITNLTIGFVLKKFLIFKGNQTKKTSKQIVLSVIMFFAFLAISVGLVYILKVHLYIQNDNVAKGITALILFFISYIINKKIVFTKK